MSLRAHQAIAVALAGIVQATADAHGDREGRRHPLAACRFDDLRCVVHDHSCPRRRSSAGQPCGDGERGILTIVGNGDLARDRRGTIGAGEADLGGGASLHGEWKRMADDREIAEPQVVARPRLIGIVANLEPAVAGLGEGVAQPTFRSCGPVVGHGQHGAVGIDKPHHWIHRGPDRQREHLDGDALAGLHLKSIPVALPAVARAVDACQGGEGLRRVAGVVGAVVGMDRQIIDQHDDRWQRPSLCRRPCCERPQGGVGRQRRRREGRFRLDLFDRDRHGRAAGLEPQGRCQVLALDHQ